LLEVRADGHLGAVFLENTGSATIYHHQLNSLLAAQTEAADSAAVHYFESSESQGRPIIQFDAPVGSHEVFG
jgi:hypothetical protein